MKRYGFFLLFAVLFFQATAQTSYQMQQIKADVVYLASDYLEGRETGKQGEQLAAEYIAWRFTTLGLEPMGDAGNWFNEFTFSFKSNPHAATGEERTGKNVVAFLDKGAATTVVIGAHYDHLGYGATGSLHAGEPAIHNGADDNASGIAALLYLAEELAANPESFNKNNYLFIAFSGEEMGLVGSKKWVGTPTYDLSKINYMLNMDMVGRLNEEKVLAVNGVGTSPVLKAAVEAIKVGDIKAKTSESGIGPSDHTSFYLQNIPVLHFFTGQHNHYHKPIDDVETLNFPGLWHVSNFLLQLIKSLDDDGRLAFTATKDENEGRSAASFKVTLGVMPDYVYDGKGMRIDSAVEGRPGQIAGMKSGDVIIQLGDILVEDIYDYMEGLSKFKKGETTTAVVQRGTEKLTLSVTF